MMQPGDTSSAITAIFANRAGFWNRAHITNAPISTRVVASARPVRTAQLSQTPNCRLLERRKNRWSGSYMEWNPAASACSAIGHWLTHINVFAGWDDDPNLHPRPNYAGAAL